MKKSFEEGAITMQRLTNWRWIAPLLAVVVVAGIAISLLAFRPASQVPAPIDTSTATSTSTPTVTGTKLPATLVTNATLVRTQGDMNISTPQPLSRTATDTNQVQQFYDMARRLTPIPDGVIYYCPEDSGVTYQLTFRTASGAPLIATLEPGGCRWLKIGEQRYQTTNEFWSTLESTFNVTERQLDDLPPGI